MISPFSLQPKLPFFTAKQFSKLDIQIGGGPCNFTPLLLVLFHLKNLPIDYSVYKTTDFRKNYRVYHFLL